MRCWRGAILLTLYGMRERRIAPVYKLIASGLMLVFL
jgi:hypothetical protein